MAKQMTTNISGRLISSSVSFVAGDIRARHLPSMSSLELSSMLAAWVDPEKNHEYDNELTLASGKEFDPAALMNRSSGEDSKKCQYSSMYDPARLLSRAKAETDELIHTKVVASQSEPEKNQGRKRKEFDGIFDLKGDICKLKRFDLNASFGVLDYLSCIWHDHAQDNWRCASNGQGSVGRIAIG